MIFFKNQRREYAYGKNTINFVDGQLTWIVVTFCLIFSDTGILKQ